jgi:hypothetical protein
MRRHVLSQIISALLWDVRASSELYLSSSRSSLLAVTARAFSLLPGGSGKTRQENRLGGWFGKLGKRRA